MTVEIIAAACYKIVMDSAENSDANLRETDSVAVTAPAVAPMGKGWGMTKNIPFPNIYVKMLPEYKNWIYLEEEAVSLKAHWASVFPEPSHPLDLEIGCGNGFFFEQQARAFQERNLLGIELKYKPLVQTVRRARKANFTHARGIRFHARYVERIFGEAELDNVYIYFPDPWPKKRHLKNRLVRREFLETLYRIQKPGRFLDFKTDSLDYFDFAEEEFKASPYSVIRHSRDLHQSEWAQENFVTSFERIFLRKGQPIYYMRLQKTE